MSSTKRASRRQSICLPLSHSECPPRESQDRKQCRILRNFITQLPHHYHHHLFAKEHIQHNVQEEQIAYGRCDKAENTALTVALEIIK